jgi:glycosyltransferase involved in cell wall biosynthesis
MYKYVFITHLPSFYKINLYNELAKYMKICVIFVSESSNIRTKDFTNGEKNFDYFVLNKEDFEKRKKVRSLLKLTKLIKRLEYKKVVVGGWDLIEFWLAILINRKIKNGVVIESTSLESKRTYFKKKIKKIFLSQISIAFPSGKLHLDLLNSLNYRGKYFITGGVGIFHYTKKRLVKQKIYNNNFLYVGRLSKEKNVDFLIDYFNEHSELNLSIAGEGPLRESLQIRSNSNIKFFGHVNKEEVHEVYEKNDVLILPSFSEPWGLVVDEALYYGLPVIVSDKVGCALELVKPGENGEIFKLNNEKDFSLKIDRIIKNYNEYFINLKRENFEKRDMKQIEAYLRGNNENFISS